MAWGGLLLVMGVFKGDRYVLVLICGVWLALCVCLYYISDVYYPNIVDMSRFSDTFQFLKDYLSMGVLKMLGGIDIV